MTKADLITSIAEKKALSLKEATLVVNTMFEDMTEALVAGERIEIRGLGSWSVKRRRAREGRNPKTGERVMVPEKRVVAFKAGKGMVERLNRT